MILLAYKLIFFGVKENRETERNFFMSGAYRLHFGLYLSYSFTAFYLMILLCRYYVNLSGII